MSPLSRLMLLMPWPRLVIFSSLHLKATHSIPEIPAIFSLLINTMVPAGPQISPHILKKCSFKFRTLQTAVFIWLRCRSSPDTDARKMVSAAAMQEAKWLPRPQEGQAGPSRRPEGIRIWPAAIHERRRRPAMTAHGKRGLLDPLERGSAERYICSRCGKRGGRGRPYRADERGDGIGDPFRGDG